MKKEISLQEILHLVLEFGLILWIELDGIFLPDALNTINIIIRQSLHRYDVSITSL